MSNTSLQLGTVDFHGHALTVITGPEGEHLVAMKPICEAIGLQWEAQLKRIKRHPVLSQGMSIMDTPSAGGEQETTCLPLDYLNGWLFGVDASRVRSEIRERLVQYQRECFAALAAYWQQGEAVNPRAVAAAATPAEPIYLTYNDRPFRIVPEGAELWFVAADVAHALDMRDAYRITRHLRSEHKSHRQVGRQRLNVIDRRGLDLALLHGPLERTEPLRLWLDAALEQYVPSAAPRALLGGLSDEQQGAIKALVSARIDALPEAQRGKAATRCWSALKSKFGCSYKEIAPEQFTEAVSLVARIVLEGELLEPEEAEAPKVIGRLPIDFPIRRWLTDNPWIAKRQQLVGPDQLVVSADMLCGMDARSPTLQLLAELEKADYNVAACRVEVLSMRHHLEMSASFFRDIRAISESAQQQGLRLKIAETKP